MVSEFLLSFGQLNLSNLLKISQHNSVERCNLTKTEVVEVFEFGKKKSGYQTRADLLKQVKNKALSIAQAFYLSYFYFFLFDNTICHLIYGQDAF